MRHWMLGFGTGLAILMVGPALRADDRERPASGVDFGDLGQSSLKREAVDLPLKFTEGKTYRWEIEAKHLGISQTPVLKEGAQKAQPPSTGMGCKHEAEAKVTKVSAGEATIDFTFDPTRCEFCKDMALKQGRKSPEKAVYNARVGQKGELLSFQPAAKNAGSQAAEWEGMLRTQARQLMGEGLHDGRLEPGKSYDVVWMHPEEWHKSSDAKEPPARAGDPAPSAPRAPGVTTDKDSSSAAGKGFDLLYDGRTRLGGAEVARFTAHCAGADSSTSAPSAAAGADKEHRMAGHACFRVEDGILEKFGLVLPEALVKGVKKQEGKPDESSMGDMLITVRRTQ